MTFRNGLASLLRPKDSVLVLDGSLAKKGRS